LSYIAFIMLRNIPSILSFFSAFIMKGVGFCQRHFFICWEDPLLLSLFLFICCITFMDLHISNHPCIPGMKLVYDLFDMLLKSV
jgi:hypothetical protein